ncbi:MAG: AAA family ATPase, partial [Planctomycetes bacterium]|nr:AAA family ATPase [Planctomycetota bacterium]
MTSAVTTEARQKLEALSANLAAVIHGKPECLDLLIVALLAGGSVLLEDVPGVGKTTLAKALAKSIDVKFQRVQFTPDLLPGDILGSSVYHPADGSFSF